MNSFILFDKNLLRFAFTQTLMYNKSPVTHMKCLPLYNRAILELVSICIPFDQKQKNFGKGSLIMR